MFEQQRREVVGILYPRPLVRCAERRDQRMTHVQFEDRLGAGPAFVPREQDEILARLHSYIVDQAMWIWVVHDLNPRAMSPKVKGFVQAQAWVQDLTPVYVAE